jgi:pimeloyl-ACP methyl ester carboxylesterase
VWAPFADALAGDFTVYLWDMPGYGRSSKHDSHAVDFGVQADAFAALLQHWDVRRPHVVAHDIGGVVSLRAHLALGAAYASLMLVDVVAIPPAGSPRRLSVLPVRPRAPRRARRTPGLHPRGDRPRLHRRREPSRAAPGRPRRAGGAVFYRQIAQYDERFLEEIERRLGEIEIPVSVLWGNDDTWIPVAVGERLAALLGTTLEPIEGAGHLIHYDAPVPLMSRLRAWLAERGE